jgi:hypothetical protein
MDPFSYTTDYYAGASHQQYRFVLEFDLYTGIRGVTTSITSTSLVVLLGILWWFIFYFLNN